MFGGKLNFGSQIFDDFSDYFIFLQVLNVMELIVVEVRESNKVERCVSLNPFLFIFIQTGRNFFVIKLDRGDGCVNVLRLLCLDRENFLLLDARCVMWTSDEILTNGVSFPSMVALTPGPMSAAETLQR